MTHPLKWLTLIPLDKNELPSFDRLAAWFGEHFPEAQPLRLASSTDKMLALTLGPYTAAVTLVSQPIPWSQLEGPAATAWYWPGAAKLLREHQAHLLIALIDDAGSAIDKAVALTRLTAAAAATAPSTGVFWGPGRLVHPVGAFIEQADDIRDTSLPLFLWVDFRVEPIDSVLRAYTTGLEALGQSEVEAPQFFGQPEELVGYLYNIAHYLLDRKQVIRDGDTIGLTDELSVTVRREPSMLGGDLEVLRLQFDAEESEIH